MKSRSGATALYAGWVRVGLLYETRRCMQVGVRVGLLYERLSPLRYGCMKKWSAEHAPKSAPGTVSGQVAGEAAAVAVERAVRAVSRSPIAVEALSPRCRSGSDTRV